MKQKATLIAIVLTFAAVFGLAGHVRTEKERVMPQYEGKVNAPEFPEGLDWLNTGRPLTLKQLRGKIVVLDFWTYCCINCMHVISDLKRLETQYAGELVVVGVHSAKFNTEKETGNIQQAVLRYEIKHPILNDSSMILWRQYGIRAWPTLVVIDPQGKVVGGLSGEGIYEPFDQVIRELIEHFDSRGLIDRRPLHFVREADKTPQSILSFPGKVLADESFERLFISDSNRNRIVISGLDGNIQDIIGSGEAGLDDGDFETATFNHPQGMALAGDTLYIADTENHAVRRALFKTRKVEKIAGSGQQSRRVNPPEELGPLAELNSPWDLVAVGDTLFIAMAGPHQIWKMDLKTGLIGPFAGSGREARIDGTLKDAALAQPSGIATDGKHLYFADSETSSIRMADLNPRGKIQTIVGLDLFEFGDKDGSGDEVRLQHPLGLAYHGGTLYVADTYNNKVKKIFPKTRQSVSFVGGPRAGLRDGEKALLDEPGGVSVAKGNLYIADTNNHLIRVTDLNTGKTKTLTLHGVEKLTKRFPQEWRGETIELDPIVVKPGQTMVVVDIELPPGFKLNEDAPTRVVLEAETEGLVFERGERRKSVERPQTLPVRLPAAVSGKTRIRADVDVYYCESGKEALCFFKEVRLLADIDASRSATASEIALRYSLH